MMISDYAKVVGVAWEAAKEAPLNYVNIGVGLTTNDLAPKVEDLSHKVDNIIAYLEGKAPLRPSTTKAVNPVATQVAQPTSAKMLTDEEFDQFLDKNADLVNQIYTQTKQELLRQGRDLKNYPELQAMFDDPIPAIKKMRRDPQLVSQWSMIDKKIQKEIKK